MKIIETKKVANVNEAIEIVNAFYAPHVVTFNYENENYGDNYDCKYNKIFRHFGGSNENGATCYGMIEIFENGELKTIRIFNFYKNLAVDIEINTEIKQEENKMTIETKIAKNGVKMYYVEGKRVRRDIALQIIADNEREEIIATPIVTAEAFQIAVDAEIALANNNHNNKIITVEDQIVLLYDNIVDAQTALSKTTNPDVKTELETNIDDWLREIATLLLPKLNENFIDSSLDFDTKDAILKAKVLVADKESQIALDSLIAAEKAYQDALRVHCDSGDKLFYAKRAHEKFCSAKARQLEEKLLPENYFPTKTIILHTQNKEIVKNGATFIHRLSRR